MIKGFSSFRKLHQGATDDYVNYETDCANTLTAETLTGADGHISYTAHLPGFSVTAYHSYNPHGDTTLLTSTTGEEWLDYTYDAFGNPLGENTLAFGYTGKWQRDKDSATGMIRMGVREYDPALGRFISVDPLKGTSTDPQQRNRYQFTGNNPLVRYDLDGTRWTTGRSSKCEDNCEALFPEHEKISGSLSLSMANEHYRHGFGVPLVVDAATIDLSNLRESELGPVGNVTSVNLFFQGQKSDAVVYGRIKIENPSGGEVRILSNEYDFDMRAWDSAGNTVRNIETLLGHALAREGNRYWICFEGTTRVGSGNKVDRPWEFVIPPTPGLTWW